MKSIEDKMLLRAMGKGSSKAFDILYRKYAPKVRSFCKALLKEDCASLSDDIVQNIFLKLWENRVQISSAVKDIDSYLFIMTKNAVLNLLSRDRHSDSQLDQAAQSVPDDIIPLIISHDTRDVVGKTLDSMPEQRRLVFRMSREEGLSHKDIARILGISTKTVEYHISKALSDLRKNLN